MDPRQLGGLASWIRGNLMAFQSGATPVYYATDASDATVPGCVLQVVFDPDQPPASWMQLTIRDGVPLQATLFQMTQVAAQALASRGPADRWQVHVAVLSTIVDHGTDTACDLDGIDCRRRALIVMGQRRWALGFDASADVQALLRETLSSQAFRSGATAVYSAVCDSTRPTLRVSAGPQARAEVSSRPPGVAGTFYPADDDQRERLVDQLLADGIDSDPRPVHAAMVPHAGLRYSGRIAAEVWRRIELPERVLIIGPKHTADGVDWAVAPHDVWELSSNARNARRR